MPRPTVSSRTTDSKREERDSPSTGTAVLIRQLPVVAAGTAGTPEACRTILGPAVTVEAPTIALMAVLCKMLLAAAASYCSDFIRLCDYGFCSCVHRQASIEILLLRDTCYRLSAQPDGSLMMALAISSLPRALSQHLGVMRCVRQ